jgi:hypothetical protein
MSEQDNEHIPAPDRYSVQYIELSSDEEGSSSKTLQDALNEGSRKSQRLIGVAQDPVGKGILLFWDLEGFISG